MSAPWDSNRYKATILRHVDADTTHAEVMLGFDVRVRLTFRWAGLDAPEISTDVGKAAHAAVQRWLPVGSTCEVSTRRDSREKFGRYLATFHLPDGTDVNAALIAEGMARPYDGGRR